MSYAAVPNAADQSTAQETSGCKTPVHVRLRFGGGAPRAEGPLWASPPLSLRHAVTGTLEVIGTARSLRAAACYALSFGAAVEVLGPPALRRRVAGEVQRLAALYASDRFSGASDRARKAPE